MYVISMVLGLWSKKFTVGWVRSFFCCLGWNWSATSGFEKIPLKNSNFSIFSPQK